MMRRSLSVEEFLAVLPDQPEFDLLRQEVLRASEAEPGADWTGPGTYTTLDRRSIPVGMVPQILADAEGTWRRRARRLYDGVAIALFGILEGNVESRLEVLLAAGAEDEAADHWRDALVHYSMAVHLAQITPNLELRALALRRLGRAFLHNGDFRQSTAQYGASLAVAAAAGTVLDEITAATGLGNGASWQGRWTEAAAWYQHALARCGPGSERERGQLRVNLSMTAREQGQLDEAQTWLDSARSDWDHLSDEDHCRLFNNEGLLHLARGDVAAAEQCFNQALAGAHSLSDRAMILDNLAEVSIQQNRLELAEARARAAEELAITLGSPRVLAEVYLRLGKLCRLRADANGVVFFEKALELSRNREYPLLYGSILSEYGAFRNVMGDTRSANALYADALSVYKELGGFHAHSGSTDE